jgi:hypothetical protein
MAPVRTFDIRNAADDVAELERPPAVRAPGRTGRR